MEMRSPTFRENELDKVTFSSRGASPVSLPDAKGWMRVSGTADDTVISDLIDGVTDELIHLTNTSLVGQTITAVYNSYGREINLPYSPITAITSVKTLNEGTKTLLTVTEDYYLQGDTLFMKKLENVGLEVIYTSGGYFPNGLRNAFKQALLTNYNDREDNVMGGVVKIPNNSRKKALRFKRY